MSGGPDIMEAVAATEAQYAAAHGTAHGGEAEDQPAPLVPRKSLADFRRDTERKNVLIRGGWGKRGGTSMLVSTMGSGKSSLQTQMVLCFARGIECCGLTPERPFKSWVIQSEDDEDRVAFDRDSVVGKLKERHPEADWNAAARETEFPDFTGKTGAAFVETLDRELTEAEREGRKPDAVIINPFNAYFGGDPCNHADCSAWWKGGLLRGHETEGIEAVFKRHMTWGCFFAHTSQPPQSAKQLREWLNDPYIAYKACGSSATPDAVRSIITFLRVPGTDTFAFCAGKNGNGLGWTDADGKKTLRQFFRWDPDGRHCWCDVPKDEWAELAEAMESCGRTGKGGTSKPPPPPPPPPRDETPVVVRTFEGFKGVVPRGVAELAVRNAVNAERRAATPPVKPLGEKQCRDLLGLMAVHGVIKILPKGTGGAKGCMCGLPDAVNEWMRPPLIDVPEDAPRAIVPGSPEADDAPAFGRSRRKIGRATK